MNSVVSYWWGFEERSTPRLREKGHTESIAKTIFENWENQDPRLKALSGKISRKVYHKNTELCNWPTYFRRRSQHIYRSYVKHMDRQRSRKNVFQKFAVCELWRKKVLAVIGWESNTYDNYQQRNKQNEKQKFGTNRKKSRNTFKCAFFRKAFIACNLVRNTFGSVSLWIFMVYNSHCHCSAGKCSAWESMSRTITTAFADSLTA